MKSKIKCAISLPSLDFYFMCATMFLIKNRVNMRVKHELADIIWIMSVFYNLQHNMDYVHRNNKNALEWC